MEHATTPEVVTINGQRMRVVDPETGLPPSLTTLLTAMRVTTQRQVVIRGYSSECADNHPLVDWLTGSFEDMDLRILVCQACALVEVHDVSTNAITLPNGMVLRLPRRLSGRSGAARRDRYLGRYSGQRRAGRVYL